MRFEFDSNNYVSCILCGCYTGSCCEYTGLVPNEPEEYADMEDWAERAQTQAYYLNAQGNLIYDAERAEHLPAEDSIELQSYTPEQVKAMGIFDAIYPVGSLYMSVNDVSPAVLFGGTWERIQDKFILASGDTYAGGTEGGSASASFTIDAHTHGIETYDNVKFVSGAVTSGSYDIAISGTTGSAGKVSKTIPTLPPYLAVYVWRRVEDPIPDNYAGFIDSLGNAVLDANAKEFMVKVG